MNESSILDFDKAQWADAIHDALSNWFTPTCEENLLNDLLITYQALSKSGKSLRHAINQVLRRNISELEHFESVAATVIQRHYVDQKTVAEVAQELKKPKDFVNRWQRVGYDKLAELIYVEEVQARNEHIVWLEQRLESPTYRSLFGVDQHIAQLSAEINQPTAPWIIAIEGIGGIGKTTLADCLMRRMLTRPDWRDIAWVTARQQSLALHGNIRRKDQPALHADALIDDIFMQLSSDSYAQRPHELAYRTGLPLREKRAWLHERLKGAAHLIVIDNLETVTDVAELLETVRGLANPSKFILTTRESLLGESDIYHFRLPDLSPSDSLALIRHEATVSNARPLIDANDAELTPIYQTVGGNPLAIRLVVGQSHLLPLERVLQDLHSANSPYAENLYTYLYQQAWQRLDEAARQTLLMMPLVPLTGGDLAYLEQVGQRNQLSPRLIGDALQSLIILNLVDSVGTLNQRRYRIHNLTRMFLMEQVLRWIETT